MAITKTQVRARLKSAKNAAERLEADVKWLVSNRAWETLGYANFSEMWEKENGFKTPSEAKVIAVMVMWEEGGNSSKAPSLPNGLTQHEIGDAIGFGVYDYSDRPGGTKMAPAVGAIVRQVEAGVPFEKVGFSRAAARKNIDEVKRARSQPRRMGKLPNELVNAGWSVYKYQADGVKEIARKAGVPDSVVVRSALDMYLNRNQKDVG